jgi:hypothetical protein
MYAGSVVSAMLIGKTARKCYEKELEHNFKGLLGPAVNYATPLVTSSNRKEMPRGLHAKDIFLSICVKFSQESKERQDDEELANIIARDLEGHLHNTTDFAKTADNAKLIQQVEVTAVNTGNRFTRFLKNDQGFVRMGLDFSVYDSTKETHEIVKFGKIVYVDPLKECSIKKRSGQDSGEKALLAILPLTSRLLINEMNLGISLARPELD